YYDRETGLAYNRFRYYSPKMGMYISQDPLRLDGSYLSLYAYVDNSNLEIDIWGLVSVLFQCGTYGSLQPSGPGLQAHEIMRHKYLQSQGLASGNRLADNPSIALDMDHHRRKPSVRPDGSMSKGGAHYHETIIRAKYGLGSNEFHQNHKIEMDITQGALRKAGIPASVARKLRKDADRFYKKLKKNTYG
ncbi:RHS repeat-associated core domain-containing protein, partial [Bacteroides fragilis]